MVEHNDCVNKNIPGPSDRQINHYLKEKLEPFPDLSLNLLKKGPILAPGFEKIAFADLKFKTPSGKIEILSEEASSRWKVQAIPDYFEPEESIQNKSSKEKKYPLYLMTPNTKNRIHSQFNNLKVIRQFSEKPLLQMHPSDEKRRNI